jgi:hypothetical protein
MNMPIICELARPHDDKGVSSEHVRLLTNDLIQELFPIIVSKLEGESLEAIITACPMAIVGIIDAVDFGDCKSKQTGAIGQVVGAMLNKRPKRKAAA